ncbi:hypothetical protein DUZ99_01000 [Xylanibacillus composti]|nr:hypothetical protein [Xylanibacillus composti]
MGLVIDTGVKIIDIVRVELVNKLLNWNVVQIPDDRKWLTVGLRSIEQMLYVNISILEIANSNAFFTFSYISP